jgi:diguanylate cyclase (GGDEF)-like protein
MVEDSAADGRLVQELLSEAGVAWQLERVERVRDAEAYLRRHHVDCVLLDLGVLDADGLEGLRRLVAADAELPLVVLTRRDDDLLSAEALRHGAQDYLAKRDLQPVMLARSVRYAIERKATELQLLHLANTDALTGVANRGVLLERLGSALVDGAGLLFVDVDNLKLVNDSFGHDAGDRLLSAVARRMLDALRPSDTVGRFGGDEFAVVCPALTDRGLAEDLAARVREHVSQPLVLGTRVYIPSISIGVALVEASSPISTDEAVANADVALYAAKRHGKARIAVFDESMRGSGTERMALLTELRTAFVEDQFRVHFQPQVSLVTGRLEAVEALVRWEHPTRGLVTAGEFIEVVEDSDMVAGLGRWVLEQSCAVVAAWPGGRPPRMAVNVSPRQCTLPGFREQVLEVVAAAGVTPDMIELEVTESALLVDDAAAKALRELHADGFRIAVDDFGTGYSSLTHLKLLPVSTVKIDRSFVAGVGEDAVDEAIVKAVLEVSRSLGLTTVGEGVETLEQRDRLAALGCDLAQGYVFDRALPAAELYRRYP